MKSITEHESVVTIKITDYQGRQQIVKDWLTVRTHRSLDQLPGSGSIDIKWNPHIRWAGLANLRLTIYIDPDDSAVHHRPLLTGFITGIKESHDGRGSKVTLDIHDKTMDLLHCNPIVTPPRDLELTNGESGANLFNPALLTPASWGRTTLGEIVRGYCKPFGIKVVDESNYSVDPNSGNSSIFEGHTTDEKETVWNTILRLCTAVGVTPYTDEYGRLILGVISSTYRESGPFKDVQYATVGPAQRTASGAYAGIIWLP